MRRASWACWPRWVRGSRKDSRVAGSKHAADFRECERDGCHRLAQRVMALGSRAGPSAARKRDELWLCAPCADDVRQATSITLNGRRFINDGAGWLIPIPTNVGRG